MLPSLAAESLPSLLSERSPFSSPSPSPSISPISPGVAAGRCFLRQISALLFEPRMLLGLAAEDDISGMFFDLGSK